MQIYAKKREKVYKFSSKEEFIEWLNKQESGLKFVAKSDEYLFQRIRTHQSSNLSLEDLSYISIKYFNTRIVGKTTYDAYVQKAIDHYDKFNNMECEEHGL